MELWQIRLSSISRLPLFSAEGPRRAAVRILGQVVQARLVLFGLVDDHLHVIVICTRQEAGWIAQGLSHALGRWVANPLDKAYICPVESRAHLLRLVEYLLRQPEHHGLKVHPALWSGSMAPDLLGARAVETLSLRLPELLPRQQPQDVCRVVGLARVPRPCSREQLQELGALRLREAAAAALALDPDLPGQGPKVVTARAAISRLAQEAELPREEILAALQICRRTHDRLVQREPPPQVLQAIRVRISLEQEAVQSELCHGAV